MSRFPDHTLKLTAPNQPQSTGEESLLAPDITVTCATLCVTFSSKHIPQTYSEIKSTWPIKSSKEEIVLSRDSKKLFEQRFVKVFHQNRKHVEAQSQRTGAPQLTLLHRGRTVRCSQQRCCIIKLFLRILQYPQETSMLESIFKTFANL